MSLRQKTITGLFWSFLSQGGKQVSQIIITVILARLLSPDDFGTLAMVTVFTNFAMIFSEMGVSSALIQKQDTHDRHYDSAFWLNIFAGIGLTLVFMAASPLIAWFYKKPELNPILLVVALNFLFSSFTIIQQTILTKEMDFKSLAVRDIVAVILAGVIGITLAYHGFGVWSLVYQLLSFTLINAILLWFLSPWRPRLQFAISDIKDIFHFSAHLTGFNILNYFSRNIDQLLIGKFLGTQALGYYSLAYKIMLYPLQNISWVISKVMFPAFSKIQDDLEKVRTSYLKMVKAISLVSFPLMTGLFAVVPEFVHVVFGPKWEQLVILIRILCVCGMMQSIGTTIGNVLLSQGRADVQLKLQLLGTAIVTTSIFIGINWNIAGVAFCYTLQSVIWVHYTLYVTNRLINLKYSEFYLRLVNPYIIGISVMSVTLISKHHLTLTGFPLLFALIAMGLVSYAFMLIFVREVYFQNKMIKIKVLK